MPGPSRARVLPTGAPVPVVERAVPPPRRWAVVLVLGTLIALGPLSIDMYLPALPLITEDLAASPAAVQLSLTGMLAGLGLGQLVIGPLSDAWGRRGPLVAGIVLHVAASLACAAAPSIEVLALLRLVQGVGVAATSVIALAVVRDLYTGRAAAATLSQLILVMGVAPVLAPTLGGVVLQAGSWRTVFVVLAGTGVLILGVAWWGLGETLPVARRTELGLRSTLGSYRELLRDRVLVQLVVVAGLTMAAVFAYVAGASFVLQEGFGLDEQTFAWVFGAGALSLIAASQLNVVLLRRSSPETILVGALAVGALAGAVLVVTAASGAGGLLGILAPLWVVLAVVALCGPNASAIALSRHSRRAGAAAAVLGATQFTLGAAAAPLAGLGPSGSAVPMAVVIASALAAGAVLARTAVRSAAAAPPARG